MTIENSDALYRYALAGRTEAERLARAFDEHVARVYGFAARMTDDGAAAAEVTRDAFRALAAREARDRDAPLAHDAMGPFLAAAAYHAAVQRAERRTQPLGAQAHHLPADFTDGVNEHVRRCRRCRAWGPIPYSSAAVVQAGGELDAPTRAAVWRDVAASLPGATTSPHATAVAAEPERGDDTAERDGRLLLFALAAVAAFVVIVGLMAGALAGGIFGPGGGGEGDAAPAIGAPPPRDEAGAGLAPGVDGGAKALAAVTPDRSGDDPRRTGDLPVDDSAPAPPDQPAAAPPTSTAGDEASPGSAGGPSRTPSAAAGAATPAAVAPTAVAPATQAPSPPAPSPSPAPPAPTLPPPPPTEPAPAPSAEPSPAPAGAGDLGTPAGDASDGAAPADGPTICYVEATIAGITVWVAVEC